MRESLRLALPIVICLFASASQLLSSDDAELRDTESEPVFNPHVTKDELSSKSFVTPARVIEFPSVQRVRFSYSDRFLIAWGSDERDLDFTRVFRSNGDCVLSVRGHAMLSKDRKVLGTRLVGETNSFWDLENWVGGNSFEDVYLLSLSPDGRRALVTSAKYRENRSSFARLRDNLVLVETFGEGPQKVLVSSEGLPRARRVLAATFSFDQRSVIANVDSENMSQLLITYNINSGKVAAESEIPSWLPGRSYDLTQPNQSNLVFSTCRFHYADFGSSKWLNQDLKVPYRKFVPPGGTNMGRIKFCDDGSWVAVYGKNPGYSHRRDVTICRDDEDRFRIHFRRELDEETYHDLAVSFSRASTHAAVAIDQEDGRLRIVDLSTGPESATELLGCRQREGKSSIVDLDFSESGNLLAGADALQNRIRIWNVETMQELDLQ